MGKEERLARATRESCDEQALGKGRMDLDDVALSDETPRRNRELRHHDTPADPEDRIQPNDPNSVQDLPTGKR